MELSLRRIENRPLDIWRGEDIFSGFGRDVDYLLDEILGGSLTGYVTPETRGAYAPRIDIKETASPKWANMSHAADPKPGDLSMGRMKRM
jgi:hypothetical protein